jgi:predicted acylesterase/phospholipase RssA
MRSFMHRTHAATAALLGMIVLCLGCLTSRTIPRVSLPPSARLVAVESGSDPATIRQTADAGVRDLPALPRNILAISGGGMKGAYSAGVLKGWTASGTRPQFDVVTGISTGALIAPLAFLGAETDDELEGWFTTVRGKDIYRRRFLPSLLWADSIADSWPLREHIETVVTPEFLERIAKAHAAGRRLYVGTTNLDTRHLVVWDLGAIAAGNNPGKLELFRKVLLASCAIPGFLPPVAIEIEVSGKTRTELHVDGGVSCALFVPAVVFAAKEQSPTHDGSVPAMVHAVISGKLGSDHKAVPRRLVDVTEKSLQGLLQAELRGDLQAIYVQARQAGAGFRVAAVPDELPVSENSILFSPRVMRRLFDEGRRFGIDPSLWRPLPPGYGPDDQSPPRTGVQFHMIETAR